MKSLAEVLWTLEKTCPSFIDSSVGKQIISDIFGSFLGVNALEKKLIVLQSFCESISSCGQEECIGDLLAFCSGNITRKLDELGRVSEWLRGMEIENPGYIKSANMKEQISRILTSSNDIDWKLQELAKHETFGPKETKVETLSIKTDESVKNFEWEIPTS